MVELNEEACQIQASAHGASRDMTAAERARVDAINAEFDDKRTQIEVAERGEVLSRPQKRLTESPPNPGQTWNMAAAPFMGATSSTVPMIGAQKSTVESVVRFARTGLRGADFGDFKNAMSIASASDGGLEVPVQLDTELQTIAANYSPLLRLAKNVVGVTDGYVQNVATTLPASAWINETGTRAATTTPNIAQVTFTRGGVYAAVQATQWLLQDSAHDLYTFIVSELGRQFGAAIGTSITTGNGTNQPTGLTAQTCAATADASRAFGTVEYVATGGATTAPTLDQCIVAMTALHPAYHAGAAWLMSRSAAAALMTQKASTAGSYLWQPDLSASQPPTLFGLPVYVDPTLPAATTGNAYSVWLGNWQQAYTVVHYGRPIMVRDDVTVKGQVIIYSEQRIGGNVTNSSALKAIKTAAA